MPVARKGDRQEAVWRGRVSSRGTFLPHFSVGVNEQQRESQLGFEHRDERCREGLLCSRGLQAAGPRSLGLAGNGSEQKWSRGRQAEFK